MDLFGVLCAKSDSPPIGDLAYFSDMFKPLIFSKICTAYLPTIDLGPNVFDEASFWTDSWGTMHVKSVETIEGLDKFSDMFGGPWTQAKVKDLASTFLSVKIKSNSGVDIALTQDYRTSIDGNTWTDWISSASRQFYGRYIQIRITGQPISGMKQLKIYSAEVNIDVPDTQEIIENVYIPAQKKHISFKQKFMATPTVTVFTADMNNKEATWQMSGLDANGFDLEIVDDNDKNIEGMLIRADIRGY